VIRIANPIIKSAYCWCWSRNCWLLCIMWHREL